MWGETSIRVAEIRDSAIETSTLRDARSQSRLNALHFVFRTRLGIYGPM